MASRPVVPETYNYFKTVSQIFALPVKNPGGPSVVHAKGTPFQDECKVYLDERLRSSYGTLGNTNASSLHTPLLHTIGLAWDKLSFPKNSITASIVASEGTYFAPKGQTPMEASTRYAFINPTPTSLHECTHVEVMLVDMCKFVPGAPIPKKFGINPNFHPKLKHFTWAKKWDQDSENSPVAGFVPCETVQKMVDDLFDVED